VPIDHFDAPSESERRHIAACAHCEAEVALWEQFEAQQPSAEEGAAVQWIAAEVSRRRNPGALPPLRSLWAGWFGIRGIVGVAAALVLMVGLTYIAWDREPAITSPAANNVYRSARLAVIGPIGDVKQVPNLALKWSSLDGAVRYDVRILEVDGTLLWHASTAASEVALPSTVISRLVPGKAVTWEVTAYDRGGAVVAASGTQRITVVP
jgi:hypothetical protein